MQDSVRINCRNPCDLSQPDVVFIFALITTEPLVRSSFNKLFAYWALVFHFQIHF